MKLPLLKPKTRGDCVDGYRPCPWVSCKYNLYVDVDYSGRLRLPFKDLEPDEIETSTLCTLDYANSGLSVSEISEVTGFHRNQIVPTEDRALRKLQRGRHLENFGAPSPRESAWDFISND